MDPVLLVGAGGVVGSVLRYACSRIPPVFGLPAGTLLVNVLGSFLLGLIVFSRQPDDVLYFLGIGGMGGFTTFSTFSYETFRMLEDQDSYMMLSNILTNVAGSILGVVAGAVICSVLLG